MKKYFRYSAILVFILAGSAISQTPFWHQTNGPEAGTVRDITIDSSGRIIIFTGGSGVYRSSDNGTSWELLNKGLSKLNMSRGAASKNGFLFGFNLGLRNQVFRFDENDPNAEWVDITPDTFRVTVNDILADPNGTLYLATTERGVLRSDDNGASWVQKNTGLIDPKIPDKEVDQLAIDLQSNLFISLAYGTIWKSTNRGDSWTELTRDPVKGKVLFAIAIAPNGNIVIGNHATSLIQGGQIFVSTDAGSTWDSVYRRPATTPEQKNQIDKIALIPGSNVLYANAHGPTLRSTDNGVTWNHMDTNKRGDEVFSMAGKGISLFQICEPDGIFLSVDTGVTWTSKSKGLVAQFMWGVAINSKQDIFGITEYGLHRSTDNGDSWELEPEYGETYFPSLYINSKDFLYIGTDRGLFRSKDNGQTLDQLIFNRDTSLKNNTINQAGENGQGKLFCASNQDTIGFLYSTDDGDHWVRIRNLPDTTATIKTFAFATKDTILLAPIFKNGFYRSIDQGETWQVLPSSLQGVTEVLIDHDGSYLALINNANGGIFHSTDEGKQWVQVFPPTDFQQKFMTFFSMTVDHLGSIIVCTDSGVYRSATGNTHFTQWYNASAGLTASDFPNHFINVSQVAENPVTKVFFAASRGLGVYRSIPGLGVSGEHQSPSSLIRLTAHPNPFTTVSDVSFTLQNKSSVRLDIYDVLGRQVKHLIDGVLDQGEHGVIFDGSSLPSGNYMVALHEADVIRTVWVTLTK